MAAPSRKAADIAQHDRATDSWLGAKFGLPAGVPGLQTLILCYLLIPVLNGSANILEVLDIAGNDGGVVFDGMRSDEDVSVVVGPAA